MGEPFVHPSKHFLASPRHLVRASSAYERRENGQLAEAGYLIIGILVLAIAVYAVYIATRGSTMTPTATPMATPTATPTATPMATPTATPTATSMWVTVLIVCALGFFVLYLLVRGNETPEEEAPVAKRSRPERRKRAKPARAPARRRR